MPTDTLVKLALFASVISMVFSCAALWPHSRRGVSSLRDVVLWSVGVFLMTGGATVAWNYLQLHQGRRLQEVPSQYVMDLPQPSQDWVRNPPDHPPSLQPDLQPLIPGNDLTTTQSDGAGVLPVSWDPNR